MCNLCRVELILIAITFSIISVMGRQRCSNRLESALESMRRRSQHAKSRSLLDLTPYSLYESFYGRERMDLQGGYAQNTNDNRRYGRQIHDKQSPLLNSPISSEYEMRRPQQDIALPITRVEVDDLKVRLPSSPAGRWVEVDKCQFSTINATLDTRLIFPDLTISGKVILHPSGGKCNMILRLRHAGIEFRTIPIGMDVGSGLNGEERRTGSASVRTDSHFAEPGFISVFAHGCQGTSGYTFRHNSKRRFGSANSAATQFPLTPPDVQLSEPQVFVKKHENSESYRWGKYFNPFDYKNIIKRQFARETETNRARNYYDGVDDSKMYMPRFPVGRRRRYAKMETKYDEDIVNFNDDILNVGDDFQNLVKSDARAFAEMFSTEEEFGDRTISSPDIGDAFTQELEKLFSMGVRGLLTTYMQRALQPAIKETLMENMGYTLSYG